MEVSLWERNNLSTAGSGSPGWAHLTEQRGLSVPLPLFCIHVLCAEQEVAALEAGEAEPLVQKSSLLAPAPSEVGSVGRGGEGTAAWEQGWLQPTQLAGPAQCKLPARRVLK